MAHSFQNIHSNIQTVLFQNMFIVALMAVEIHRVIFLMQVFDKLDFIIFLLQVELSFWAA